MPGYSFFKSEGENYGNVKSIYTRDIRNLINSFFLLIYYIFVIVLILQGTKSLNFWFLFFIAVLSGVGGCQKLVS